MGDFAPIMTALRPRREPPDPAAVVCSAWKFDHLLTAVTIVC
jgi:hypothetical protein